MILKKWSLVLIVAALVAPLSASALGIANLTVTSTGASTTTVNSGDVLTFDLTLENNGAEQVFGLGIGAWGYDDGLVGDQSDNRLIFLSGENAAQVLSVANNGTQGFGGIDGQGGPVETGIPFPIELERRVQAFNGISTAGTIGTGGQDIGATGGTLAGGDVHIRLRFVARELTGLGNITIDFGVGEFGNAAVGAGGAVLGFTNASHTLTVVPEPGTALLMGLGLAGLATTRRR